MNTTCIGRAILQLSLPLAVLIVLNSSIGLVTADFYSKETLNWQAQAFGQDIIDLFLISPLLLITSLFAYRNSRIARMIWSGVILYIIYTYTIYCFDVHFNSLFLVYSFILGLSFYSFLYFVLLNVNDFMAKQFRNTRANKITGFYFLIIATLFYFLWLSEIIPAIVSSSSPKGLIDIGLFTNPVHVLDLAVFLPGIFITGILMLKQNRLALLFVPALLVFFILMDITIGTLVIVMNEYGIASNRVVAIVMSVLALLSSGILLLYLRGINNKSLFNNSDVVAHE